MDAVRQVKRLTRVKRVGHAGTLDPIATGVLPICFGQATRLMEFLIDGRKVYRAEFTLGTATDTYDAYGEPVNHGDWSKIDRGQVEALLTGFVGATFQKPPMYSALKHEGKRLYDLARAGVHVDRPAREVVVYRLALLEWAPPSLTVEAECGRGFYMRTLAQDIGSALGCGAHLSGLARLRAGPLELDQAVTLEEFEATVERGDWEDWLEPPDFAVASLPGLTVPLAAEPALRNGQPIAAEGAEPHLKHLELRRVYAANGRFIGLVRFDRAQSQWRPEKLFTLSLSSRYAPA